MRTKLARFVLHTAFGVGLCATTAALGHAQDYHYIPQGPTYVKPSCPYPTVPTPGMPSATVPAMPGATTPSTTTPGATTPSATTPSTTTPEAQNAANETANAAPSEAGAAESAFGGTGAGGGGGMLGRGDADNRFNLFDNNSAFPTNRVWFNFQYMQNFNTGLAQPSGTGFATKRTLDLYRVGGEVKLGSQFSISFQDQYIASEGTAENADAWGDPEIMLKWAMINEDCRAVAATLGIQPQVSSSPFELHEKDTRFLPGLLVYQSMDDLFVQGGFQLGFDSRNAATTFDWAVSAGYWVYRCNSSDGNSRLLSGVAPQIEVYGAHTLVGAANVPYDLPTGLNDTNVHFQEPRNVIDVTAGGRVLLMDRVNLSAGVSFPITGPDVRRTEFLTGVNVIF
jgi:hypothetical protein